MLYALLAKPHFLHVALALFIMLCGEPASAQNEWMSGLRWVNAKEQGRTLQRPRSFPGGTETSELFAAAINGPRKRGFAALTERLDRVATVATSEQLIAATRTPQTAVQQAMAGVKVKNAILKDANSAQEAGFAALVTGSQKYQRDAMRVLLALAALDPRAETSVAREPLSAMLVTRTLALGMDWFYADWTSAQRQQLTAAISVRMEDFALKLVRGPVPMEKNPLVSHDAEVLGALAETAVLMLGETPRADIWFDEFVPLYARLLTPFGGADGGYANGTTYASWDVGEYSLRHWDTLRRAIGLDLTKKAWAQNFGRYLAYFLPPGTPAGTFGDGAEVEMKETWARYAKAYADRVPTPLNRWYAAQWFQEDPARLELLTGPVIPPGPTPFPVDTANAAIFPSIGWVAFHSSLQDRSRTSLYFKSSPYGSVSHSHSDQNSFVLNAAGRQLLVDSGYYDYFGSPHHFGWTRRTVAHNAVTFDGGKGQDDPAKPWGAASANGKIVGFSTSANIDWAIGDATPAYRGQLNQATRAIVYLRPNLFLIFDWLDSTLARKWEWNMHAVNKFEPANGRALAVFNTDAKACIYFEANTPTTFQQTSAFPVPPLRSMTEPRPDQWHGQYVTDTATALFRSVSIVTLDCAASTPAIAFNSTSTTVRVSGKTIVFDEKAMKIKYE